MVPSGWIGWLGGPTSGTAVVVLVAVVDAAFFPVMVAVTVGGGRSGCEHHGDRARDRPDAWYRRIFGASETCPLLLTLGGITSLTRLADWRFYPST